jgi:hypothetical protein
VNEELWIPLVDEPIGAIVADLEQRDPELTELLDTPRKLLAFRTFSYIRVGVILGRLLVEREQGAPEPSETWVDALYRDPAVREELEREVRQIAEEIAAEPEPVEEPQPDEAARARFREFARETLDEK